MTPLLQALTAYCQSGAPADRQALIATLLGLPHLLGYVLAKMKKNIPRSDQDRFESIEAYKQDPHALCDMIVSLYVDNNIEEFTHRRRRRRFDINTFTTDSDFAYEAGKVLRRFIDLSAIPRAPMITNALATNRQPQPLVVNAERPQDMRAGVAWESSDEASFRERLLRFEDAFVKEIESKRSGRRSNLNNENILIWCAFANHYAELFEHLSAATWTKLVNNAAWFFKQQARNFRGKSAELRMREAVTLLCEDPRPNDFGKRLLGLLSLTDGAKNGRVTRVDDHLIGRVRQLLVESGFNPGRQDGAGNNGLGM
jgi:hypothetical protein